MSPSPDPPPASSPGRFHIGCAVWGHPGWLGPVYPAGTSQRRQLAEYCRRFTAVEGNALFYGLPGPDTIARWADTMPEGFRLLPKLPRELSHDRPLAEGLGLRDHVLERLAPLGPRTGPVFLQLPPSYGPERRDDLLAFLDAWPATAPPLCVELRHLGWFGDPVGRELQRDLVQRAIGRVVLDTRPIHAFDDGDPQFGNPRKKPRLPVPVVPPANHVMLRFVGHPDRPRNDPWLVRWAERLHGWLDEGRALYVFCHCPVEDHSPFLVRRLQALLEERGAPVPSLPWDALDERRQADLF